jgi:DNA repair protein RadD
MNKVPRPHQVKAIDMLKQSLISGKKRPVIQAPTGFGKTLLSAMIVEGALKKGNKVIFVVPALSLIDQTVEAFYHEGITEIGVIQANHYLTDYSKPIQIASVQTLMKREIPEVQIVVIDECHRMFDFVCDWMAMEAWQKIPFVGLSATPWTKGMGKFYDDLLIAGTTEDLIEKGFLIPFRVFASAHPDLTGVKNVAGDFHEGQLADVMSAKVLVAGVVETWLAKGENRPTFCFAVDCAHAQKLQQEFQDAGVGCGYIDAFTKMPERMEVKRQFHAGEIKVVCNVGTMTTGIDWDVRCISMARPTRSEILFVQIVGRGLRTADGKKDLLILDHSDNHLRLGFVTDIQHETLNSGKKDQAGEKKEKKEPLPKECPSCQYLKPAKVHKCPNCGFEPVKQSGVVNEDGELTEFTGKKKLKKHEYSNEEKQQFYSGLIYIQQERGYKEGWGANQFREKFGVWPNGYEKTSIFPSPEVSNYVRSRQIAYAKSRKVANG